MDVSEPGTPLDGSGSKFRSKCRARELRSIYGDPFREDFVQIGVGQRSGASSFTFFSFVTVYLVYTNTTNINVPAPNQALACGA